jgi:hypothetical protein
VKKLLEDDVCRVCFHGPHAGKPCIEVDPPDINPYKYRCGCTEYVDLDAESRIIVRRKDIDEGKQQLQPDRKAGS